MYLVRARLCDGGLAAIDGFGRKEMGTKEIGEFREWLEVKIWPKLEENLVKNCKNNAAGFRVVILGFFNFWIENEF